jgi:hypothetical protein
MLLTTSMLLRSRRASDLTEAADDGTPCPLQLACPMSLPHLYAEGGTHAKRK